MKHKGLVASMAVMLLWGLLFPLVKLGYRLFGIQTVGDVLAFAGLRFLICGAIITVFTYLRSRESLSTVKNNWTGVLMSGLAAIILHYSFYYIGLRSTDGSKTAILKQLGAIFYVCCASWFFPEDKLTWKKAAALLLGVLGILAINAEPQGIRIYPGDLLILCASFCTVFSNVISKKTFRTVDPIACTGVSQIFGGAVLLIVGLCAGGSMKTVTSTTWEQGIFFLAMAAASVISYCLWFCVVKKEDLSKLFFIKFSEPLFAALFGWLILGEDVFNLRYAAAFLLISGGIVVANFKKQKSKV